MKINEKGELEATAEELAIVSGTAKKAVETALEAKPKEVGAEDVKVPGVVKAAQQEKEIKIVESFDAPANEKTYEKSLRLAKASLAISGGDLAVVNAPKELKMIRFLKAVAEKDGSVLGAIAGQTMKALGMSEGSLTDGGNTVPVEFDTDLKVAIEEYSLSGLCTNHTMTTAEMDLRSVSTKPTVYQVAEGIAVTQGAPKTAAPVLTAKAFAGLQTMSKELFYDNNVGLYQKLVMLYGEALGARRDAEIIGTGATFTGVLKSVTPQVVTLDGTSIENITYKKIVRLTNSITDGQKANGAYFVMHRLIWTVICELTDQLGRPIVQNPWDAKNRTLLGYPVKLTEAAPSTDAADTAFIAFGNFKWVDFGLRQGSTASILTEATVASVNLAEQRALGLIIDERWGVVVSIPSYFAIIKTAA